MGGKIWGAGRFATRLQNTSTGGTIIHCDAVSYSVFEGIEFVSAASGCCVQLAWWPNDPNTIQGGSQSDAFYNCYFASSGTACIEIGVASLQSSENLIENCYLGGNGTTTKGVAIGNANALANSVIGGNIASCDYGIWVGTGACPMIHGVSFQEQVTADIYVGNSSGDMYSIHACRSENINNNFSFLVLHAGASAHVGGCTLLASGTGIVFAFIEGGSQLAGPGALTIENCSSHVGILTGNGFLYIRGNRYPPLAITNAVDNGSGLIRLTVTSNSVYQTGDANVQVSGVVGTGGLTAAANGFWTITVIGATTIDLQGSAFVGTYTSGGLFGGHMFGDTAYLASFTGRVVQNI